jgi:hypothetical protein
MTISKGRAKQQRLVSQSSGGLPDVPHGKVSCHCHKTIATNLRNRDGLPQSKRTRRAPRGEHAPLEASEANNAAPLRATVQIASPRRIKTHSPTAVKIKHTNVVTCETEKHSRGLLPTINSCNSSCTADSDP